MGTFFEYKKTQPPRVVISARSVAQLRQTYPSFDFVYVWADFFVFVENFAVC